MYPVARSGLPWKASCLRMVEVGGVILRANVSDRLRFTVFIVALLPPNVPPLTAILAPYAAGAGARCTVKAAGSGGQKQTAALARV